MTGSGHVEQHRLWSRLNDAVRNHPHPLSSPVAVVDLDVFDTNAKDLAQRANGTPVRVASKSLRVPALIRRALTHAGFEGVLSYTLAEALWLVEHRVSDDVVVAYPSVDRGALARLLADESAIAAVTLMVDDVAHLDVVDSCRSGEGPVVRVALDVDAGLQVAGQHVGPKRSPLRSVEQVTHLAREVTERSGFQLVGLMTYEGQVAGVADDVPGQRARSRIVRGLKRASVNQLGPRRSEIVRAIGELTDLEFFNAGGSGSLETSSADPAVTEVTAGSGLLVPALFDHYVSFEPRPAAFFGLPVTRRPGPDVVTVHGGGLIASGPTGGDRAPLPWAPPGLSLTAMEGAGEVQTPLTGHAASLLNIADLVWFRHAKSGELFEHVPTAHLVRGRRITESVSTYRGHGVAF